jgi:hypothetical protein
MRRFAVALAVYAFTLSGASSAQQQPTAKTILLFIDDLQILFRDTPRLRTGLKQVSERLTTAGWSFAVASDGSSEVSIAPTSDTTALVSIANKISGGGLTPNELANPTPYVERDITRRSIMARRELQTAVDVAHPDAVLYITQGELPGTGWTIPVVLVRPEGIEAAFIAIVSGQ